MKNIKKMLIIILIILFINIPLKAWTIPTTYTQEMFELRGSWVSTVSNIDIEKQATIEQYKASYLKILNTFESFHMNAVFFQVRPTNDAFYISNLNPWSRFLIGSEGRDPGWDPLDWMIKVTHERGMEFHAWLNPYRASLDIFSQTVDGYLTGLSGSTRDTYFNQYMNTIYQNELLIGLGGMSNKNFAKKHPEYLIQGGKRLLLNPGLEEVRSHIYNTIEEIVINYDVDAIHFDDYFYNDVSFDSDKQLFMQDTQSSEYNLAKHKDWRREQVNKLIQGIHIRLNTFNDQNNRHIQFGISPAGGWAPAISPTCPATGYGMEGGMEGYPCNGYSSYHDLFADTKKWVKEEWIDYILPQNYFELGRYHEEISDWWSRTVAGTKVRLYMGLGPFKYNEYSYLTENEYINQLRFNGQYQNISGYVLFSSRNLVSPNSNKMSNSNQKIKSYWTKTPLLPVLLNGTSSQTTPQIVDSSRQNNKISIKLTTNPNEAGYAVYRASYNETVELTQANISFLVPNNKSIVIIRDDVINSERYTYYLKSISKAGELSSTYQRIDFNTTFINSAPIIDEFTMSASGIYLVGEIIHLTGQVSDANQDDLSVELFYTSDGTRYRNSYLLELVDGCFSFDFKIPNIATNNAHFKLEVFDGSVVVKVYSKEFYVLNQDLGFLERQMYFTKMEIQKAFNEIFKP